MIRRFAKQALSPQETDIQTGITYDRQSDARASPSRAKDIPPEPSCSNTGRSALSMNPTAEARDTSDRQDSKPEIEPRRSVNTRAGLHNTKAEQEE